jgi:hypothetical protein
VVGGGADGSGQVGSIVVSATFPVTGSDGREGWKVEMTANDSSVGGAGGGGFTVYAICI